MYVFKLSLNQLNNLKLLTKTTQVSTIDGACNTNEDCNTKSGLSCQKTSCKCSNSFKWNPVTLTCNLCDQNYIKEGSYCGMFDKSLFYFKKSLFQK